MGRGIKGLILTGIIILALLLRLKGITNPLLDDQAWRQADTASIALHMSGKLADFPEVFFPHLSYDAAVPQKVELEFPFLPYLLACTWSLLGWSDVWGRLWSVLFSILTVWGIYNFAGRIFSERVGLLASAIYAVMPLSVYYGRVIMPEPVAQCFSIWALDLIWSRRNTPGLSKLLGAGLLLAAAILAKLPQLMLLPVALFLGFWPFRRSELLTIMIYLLFTLFLPVVYYIWVHFGSENSLQFVSGIFSGQIVGTGAAYWEELGNNLNAGGMAFPIIVLALAGGLRLVFSPSLARTGLVVWLLVCLLYVGIVCSRISLDYYLVPVVPLTAILCALALDFLNDIPGTVGGMIVVCLLCFYTVQTLDPKYSWDNRYLVQAEWLKQNTPAHSNLILSDCTPMTFYYARRVGFRLLDQDDREALAQLETLPALYLVHLPESGRKAEFWQTIKNKYPEIGPGVYLLGKIS
ncbi:MAG: glycosyltransferase family 39 protein [Desulfitobacteriaceae bacterium]|nr:glycosyltransferase family 39 protein [Desulfitobacteriaceae bacterium]MDD4346170.1 glycosyltransferase family 39 protein [Desulfitobacteriaceae bacterium]MDD4400873.1 glycosyltransferase family 39 protein [Desulfitobacteriaceae bacterium]